MKKEAENTLWYIQVWNQKPNDKQDMKPEYGNTWNILHLNKIKWYKIKFKQWNFVNADSKSKIIARRKEWQEK